MMIWILLIGIGAAVVGAVLFGIALEARGSRKWATGFHARYDRLRAAHRQLRRDYKALGEQFLLLGRHNLLLRQELAKVRDENQRLRGDCYVAAEVLRDGHATVNLTPELTAVRADIAGLVEAEDPAAWTPWPAPPDWTEKAPAFDATLAGHVGDRAHMDATGEWERWNHRDLSAAVGHRPKDRAS